MELRIAREPCLRSWHTDEHGAGFPRLLGLLFPTQVFESEGSERVTLEL
jgi:hypothetical protein